MYSIALPVNIALDTVMCAEDQQHPASQWSSSAVVIADDLKLRLARAGFYLIPCKEHSKGEGKTPMLTVSNWQLVFTLGICAETHVFRIAQRTLQKSLGYDKGILQQGL